MASRVTIDLDSTGYTIQVRRDGKIYTEVYRVDAQRGRVGCISGNHQDIAGLLRLAAPFSATGRAAHDLMRALEV